MDNNTSPNDNTENTTLKASLHRVSAEDIDPKYNVVVIDGCNIAYSTRVDDNPKAQSWWRRTVTAARELKDLGAVVLTVCPQWLREKGWFEDYYFKELLAASERVIFVDTKDDDEADDRKAIALAFLYGGYILTNDEFSNHVEEEYVCGSWLESALIKFHFDYRAEFHPHLPPELKQLWGIKDPEPVTRSRPRPVEWSRPVADRAEKVQKKAPARSRSYNRRVQNHQELRNLNTQGEQA